MLRATTWTPGRRRALIGASAAVVCLGGLLAACAGGGDGDGYVAVGVPGDSGTATASPSGEVTLVPLETQGPPPKASREPQEPGNSPAGTETSVGPTTAPRPTPSAEGAKPSRTPTSSPTPTPSALTPAALTWSEPERDAAEERWCEKVTLGFRNSGGSPVRSGSVTFGTHIIGALGVDWGTVESVAELPAPIAGGVRKERTWTVCVDAWRVPLGMHVETRDVTVRWE
ncbi:putative secreted protein [Streptomyces davaonensis JCM 4913]|uniref:Putative secreted protein n=1 Tax=Streptomyces davaonensis (strain DSM 101723 / JCM 4913 / KCC S-0913 / 768) TaxID=1214101 RepID=K4QY99_STRDJ|nr:hypothetical protein [Streptomyces davaonensis]CCK29041.1 putative secreted protein [Streptomyces davaonensis JCM 4913]